MTCFIYVSVIIISIIFVVVVVIIIIIIKYSTVVNATLSAVLRVLLMRQALKVILVRITLGI